MKTKIQTNRAPAAIGPYSQGIKAGNFIFTAGQIHTTPEGVLVQGSIEDKTHRVMQNLQAVLSAAGVTFANVVKTTVYLTDMSVFAQFNAVYASYMTEPYPARETIVVVALPKGAEIEISMIAAVI